MIYSDNSIESSTTGSTAFTVTIMYEKARILCLRTYLGTYGLKLGKIFYLRSRLIQWKTMLNAEDQLRRT